MHELLLYYYGEVVGRIETHGEKKTRSLRQFVFITAIPFVSLTRLLRITSQTIQTPTISSHDISSSALLLTTFTPLLTTSDSFIPASTTTTTPLRTSSSFALRIRTKKLYARDVDVQVTRFEPKDDRHRSNYLLFCGCSMRSAARSASLRHFLSILAASSAAFFSAFWRLRSDLGDGFAAIGIVVLCSICRSIHSTDPCRFLVFVVAEIAVAVTARMICREVKASSPEYCSLRLRRSRNHTPGRVNRISICVFLAQNCRFPVFKVAFLPVETAVFGVEEEPDGCDDDGGKDQGEQRKVDFVVYFGRVEAAGAGSGWSWCASIEVPGACVVSQAWIGVVVVNVGSLEIDVVRKSLREKSAQKVEE
ncbi:hypothetical protein KCU65_g431, partial [Aureobasidium melanogenum]